MRSVIFLVLMMLSPLSLANNQIGEINSQARAMIQLYIDGNILGYSKYIYPKIIELSGGRSKMIASIKEEIVNQNNENLTTTGIEIISITDPIKAGNELHSVVEYSLMMSSEKGPLEVKTYFVASSNNQGVDWRFVDGTALSSISADEIFPSYNKSLQLPVEVELSSLGNSSDQYVDIDTYMKFSEELKVVYASGMTDAFIHMSKQTDYMSGFDGCLKGNNVTARVLANLIDAVISEWITEQPNIKIEIAELYAAANKHACSEYLEQ